MEIINGYLDIVEKTVITGWAFSTETAEPVQIKLNIDGKLVEKKLANTFRPDILEKRIHPTGNCGYVFQLEKKLSLNNGAKINVFAGESDCELKNSPWFYYDKEYIKRVANEIEKRKNKMKGTSALIVGWAKSGTSILTSIIASGLNNCDVYFEPGGIEGFCDINLHTNIFKNKNVVTKILYHPRRIQYFDFISELYDKKIWIVRDPRDWLISSYFYHWYKIYNRPKKDFEKAYELVKGKEEKPETIPFYKLLGDPTQIKNNINSPEYAYRLLINRIKGLSKNWFILKYEDLMERKVDSLNDYLGIEVNTEVSVDPSVKRVERTKTYGNWRRWFNEEDVSFLKPLFNEFLKLLNYDCENWDLIKTEKLSSKEGSAYMKKLYDSAPKRRESDLERTSKHWAKERSIGAVFWKGHPVIRRYISRRVTGNPSKDVLPYVIEKHFPQKIHCGLSLACGHGALERQLLTQGWAQTMHGLDLSDGAIANAKKDAEACGLGERTKYWVDDFNSAQLSKDRYDAVFSFSAAHHCAELEHLFDAIASALPVDGLFVINEYMGPSQFQLPDYQVELINEVLNILPAKYRRSIAASTDRKEVFKNRFQKASLTELESIDASEAIRSGEIRRVFQTFFETVEYKPYGGNILHFLMSGIAGNFDPKDEVDVSVIELIALMEEKLETAQYLEPDCALLVGRPKRRT